MLTKEGCLVDQVLLIDWTFVPIDCVKEIITPLWLGQAMVVLF